MNHTISPARATASSPATTTMSRAALDRLLHVGEGDAGGHRLPVAPGDHDQPVVELAVDAGHGEGTGGRAQPGDVGEGVGVVLRSAGDGADDVPVPIEVDERVAADVEGRRFAILAVPVAVPGPGPGLGAAVATVGPRLGRHHVAAADELPVDPVHQPPLDARDDEHAAHAGDQRHHQQDQRDQPPADHERPVTTPGAARTRSRGRCGSGAARRRRPSCAGRRCSSPRPRRCRRSRTARRDRGSGSSTAPAPG